MSPQNSTVGNPIQLMEIDEIASPTATQQNTITSTIPASNTTTHSGVVRRSSKPLNYRSSVSVTSDFSHERSTSALKSLSDTPSSPLDGAPATLSLESLRRRYSVIEPPSAGGGKRRISSGVAASRSRHQHVVLIWILFVFCATNFCLGMCNSLIAPFFPHEATDRKGGTVTMAGIVMGSFECVMFLLAPVVGNYMHRIGTRFLLLAGPFVVGICTILFGFLHWSPAGTAFFSCALAVRLVAGVGAISYYVTSIAVRSLVFRNSFGFAFGLVQASLVLGLVAGPAVGGAFYALGGFGLPFFVCGSLALLLDVCQAFTVSKLGQLNDSSSREDSKKDDQDTAAAAANVNKVERKPTMLAFCSEFNIFTSLFIYFWAGFTITFYETTISLHVLPLLNGEVSRVGLIILIAGVGEASCAPAIGWLQDRGLMPARWATVAGCVLSASGFLLLGPSPLLPFLHRTLWFVAVGTALLGCGQGCLLSPAFKLASDSAAKAGFPASEQTMGILAGGFASFYSFGAFVGPVVSGILYDRIGFRWSSTIVGLTTAAFFVMSVVRALIY